MMHTFLVKQPAVELSLGRCALLYGLACHVQAAESSFVDLTNDLDQGLVSEHGQ